MHAPLTLVMGTMRRTTASGATQDEVAGQPLAAGQRLAVGPYQTACRRLRWGHLVWEPLGVGRLALPHLAWGRLAWWAVWWLPLVVAVLLATRRLEGALAVQPPLLGVAILVGLGLAGTAAALVLLDAKRGLRAADTKPARPGRWLLGLTPPAATLATTWAVWLPGRGATIPCLLLVCALAQVVLFFGGTWGAHAHRRVRAGRVETAAQPGQALQAETCLPQPVVPLDVHEVDQHLIRGRDASGRELVAGTLRLTLPQGSQHATTHVAFCPPLQGTPEVQCQQQSGPEARLRVTQAAPFGARVEARLPRPADDVMTVCVQFTAAVPAQAVAERAMQAALQPSFGNAAGAIGRDADAAATGAPSGSTQGE